MHMADRTIICCYDSSLSVYAHMALHAFLGLFDPYHSVSNIVQFRLTGCMAVNLQYKSSLAGDAVKHAGIILVHK